MWCLEPRPHRKPSEPQKKAILDPVSGLIGHGAAGAPLIGKGDLNVAIGVLSAMQKEAVAEIKPIANDYRRTRDVANRLKGHH